MYVGHGNHTMQGVEIYKGKPIFYNVGVIRVPPEATVPIGGDIRSTLRTR